MRKLTLFLAFALCCLVNLNAQLLADAGPNKTICQGDSVQIGGNPTGITGTTFLWDNASSLDTATNANPYAFPTVTTTYTVTVSDINGRSNTDQMTVTVMTPSFVDAGSDTLICLGDSVQIGGNPSGAIKSTFLWSDSASLDSHLTSNPWAYPSSTTSYVLTMTDSNGCKNRDTVVVSVFEADIELDGFSLKTSISGASYQWLDCDGGDTAITDADDQDFAPLLPGNYSVVVTFQGCVDTSDCLEILTVGFVEWASQPDFTVYPNPASNTIAVNANAGDFDSIQIMDIQGKLILSASTSSTIDISDLKEGIYLLRLKGRAGVRHSKFLKKE